MATELVRRSPLQYELLAETLQAAQPWGQPRVAPAVQSVLREGNGEAPHVRNSTTPSATPGLAHRSFVVSVFPSPEYHHRTMARNSPLYGPWPRDEGRPSGPPGSSAMMTAVAANSDGYRETFVHNALKAVVPESASKEALCDWRPRAEWKSSVSGSSSTPLERHLAAVRIQERRARRAHANRSILSSLVGRAGDGNPDE